MSKKVKIFAIVALAIALVIAAFSFLGSSTSAPAAPASNTLVTSSGQPVAAALNGQAGPAQNIDQFSILLSTIQSISIDTTIFQNKAYVTLRDNPIQVGTDIAGRPNPFAPLGTDAAGTSGNQTTSTQPVVTTLQPGKLTSTSAELTAQVTLSDTTPTSVVFEYGTDDTFGSITQPSTLTRTGTVVATVTKLTPNTLYYVRADVVRGTATMNGNSVTFTTLTPPTKQ
jgi:hypothetical protein